MPKHLIDKEEQEAKQEELPLQFATKMYYTASSYSYGTARRFYTIEDAIARRTKDKKSKGKGKSEANSNKIGEFSILKPLRNANNLVLNSTIPTSLQKVYERYAYIERNENSKMLLIQAREIRQLYYVAYIAARVYELVTRVFKANFNNEANEGDASLQEARAIQLEFNYFATFQDSDTA